MVSATVLFLVPAIISVTLYTIVGQILVRKERHRRNHVLTAALLLSCFLWVILGVITYFCRFVQVADGSLLSELQHTLTVCVTGWQQWLYDYDCDNQPRYNQVTLLLRLWSSLFATFSAFANSFCLLIVVKKFWDPLVHLRRLISGGARSMLN